MTDGGRRRRLSRRRRRSYRGRKLQVEKERKGSFPTRKKSAKRQKRGKKENGAPEKTQQEIPDILFAKFYSVNLLHNFKSFEFETFSPCIFLSFSVFDAAARDSELTTRCPIIHAFVNLLIKHFCITPYKKRKFFAPSLLIRERERESRISPPGRDERKKSLFYFNP